MIYIRVLKSSKTDVPNQQKLGSSFKFAVQYVFLHCSKLMTQRDIFFVTLDLFEMESSLYEI